MSEELCTCGDNKADHDEGTGECLICYWSPTEDQACQEFRPLPMLPGVEEQHD